MPLVRTPPVTSWFAKTGLALLVLAATLSLPYLFPVSPSVSLSYVTHFSNQAATIIFIAGALCFAWLTQARIAEPDGAPRDHRLSYVSLVGGLLCTLLFLWADLFEAVPHVPGSEFYYNVNRVAMLASGLRPYRDFEYAYGPLHLYVPWLYWKLSHQSIVTAYYVWLAFSWLLGAVITWYIARWLPLQQRWRELIFWALLLTRMSAVWGEGTAYTPLRTVGAAFLILAVHAIWQRTRSAWTAVLSGVGAVALGLGISPEQGAGVSGGLLLWFGLLSWKERPRFPVAALCSFLAGCLLLFALGLAGHLFATAAIFSRGAYSFPVVLSSLGMLTLLTYLAAPCAAMFALAGRDYESSTIPLALGGLAMMSAALGRCDLGHMQFASPALVCGIAWIQTRPSLRRSWATALLFVYLLPSAVEQSLAVERHVKQAMHAHALTRRAIPAATGAPTTPLLASKSSPGEVKLALPCPIVYRTPLLVPKPFQTPEQGCLETGYYMSMANVLDEDAIHRKIAELDTVPRKPLLLPDVPLDEAFRAGEDDPKALLVLEDALIYPRARRTAVNFSEIASYIRANYTADAVASGNLRVWRPKHME